MVTKYGSALSQSLKFNYFLQVTQVEIYKPREAKYTEFWVDFNEGTRYNGQMNDEHFNTEVVQMLLLTLDPLTSVPRSE